MPPGGGRGGAEEHVKQVRVWRGELDGLDGEIRGTGRVNKGGYEEGKRGGGPEEIPVHCLEPSQHSSIAPLTIILTLSCLTDTI